MSKYAISRLGRKLAISDDPRILVLLPKDIPERIWLELLQTEEAELICLDLREEIMEAVNSIIFDSYMKRQSAKFTVYCTGTALLEIMNCHFFRHDPGEEASAAPACFIPRRAVSWVPDPIAPPSRMDNMMQVNLQTDAICPELFEFVPAYAPAEEVDMPVIKPIPEQYWFPGQVNLKTTYVTQNGEMRCHVMSEDPDHKRPDVELVQQDGEWQFVETVSSGSSSSTTASQKNVADIEVVERVTEYPDQSVSTTEATKQEAPKFRDGHTGMLQWAQESRHSLVKPNTPVDGQLQGAGDSTVDVEAESHKKRCKPLLAKAQSCMSRTGLNSRLPPMMVHSDSVVTAISDCRIRNLRLETQYEISSEKQTSMGEEITKNRKKK